MSGKFVISLDFELMWGGREHRTIDGYGDAILGGRDAIPKILDLFTAYGVSASWASVGLLFAKTREDMIRFSPALKPEYADETLSPYPAIQDEIGENEDADPYYYGRSLIDLIAQTKGQELACHSFSHYYCLEPGQTLETFRADLESFLAIAKSAGVSASSIVFPRNQMSPDHIEICKALGITVYRGNPPGYIYSKQSKAETTPLVRIGRLLDSIVPIDGMHAHDLPKAVDGKVDVPASRFLRPLKPKIPVFTALHLRRIKSEMKYAAKHGKLYHLWWHPHNFGRHMDYNLKGLESLLEHYRALSGRYGMQSVTMGSFAP